MIKEAGITRVLPPPPCTALVVVLCRGGGDASQRKLFLGSFLIQRVRDFLSSLALLESLLIVIFPLASISNYVARAVPCQA